MNDFIRPSDDEADALHALCYSDDNNDDTFSIFSWSPLSGLHDNDV